MLSAISLPSADHLLDCLGLDLGKHLLQAFLSREMPQPVDDIQSEHGISALQSWLRDAWVHGWMER